MFATLIRNVCDKYLICVNFKKRVPEPNFFPEHEFKYNNIYASIHNQDNGLKDPKNSRLQRNKCKLKQITINRTDGET